MPAPIRLSIPLGAVVTVPGKSGTGQPIRRDARELLAGAAKAAGTRPVPRGTIGKRFDVPMMSEDTEWVFRFAGGDDLIRLFGIHL